MLTVVCVVAMLCGLILGGCEENSDLENGEQVVVVESKESQKEQVLTFFAPIDGKSSGAVAYRKLIDEYNSSHKGVHVIFEGIATARRIQSIFGRTVRFG